MRIPLVSISGITLFFTYCCLFPAVAKASRGDQLREFKECVQFCINQNCNYNPTPLPLHLRLLWWNCPQECDYSCQRTITKERIKFGLPIEQFHGKWPFRRFLGIQEPFSVIFSLLNLYAHVVGLRSLKREVPENYPLQPYYRYFAYFGFSCWFWSSVFHTRDFVFTERMDYFAAGANVLYGLFCAPIRVFRLYQRNPPLYYSTAYSSSPMYVTSPTAPGALTISPGANNIIRVWAFVCMAAYALHVYYLTFVTWDYTYNMAANVVVGALTNLLWTYFSIMYYGKLRRVWAAWPGLIVMWLIMAMSLELLDFPPIADAVDAHSLWHAATIVPTLWWYRFLIKDARQDIEGARVRLKA